MENIVYASLILSFLLLTLIIFTAYALKNSNNSNLYDSILRNSPIDGIRGILALSVMAHHFYITYIWKTNGLWEKPDFKYLDNLGAVSVSLFFFITGYLFLNKLKNSNINWSKIFISRFLRIFPLFFFVSAIVIIITSFSINSYSNNFDFFKFSFKWLIFLGDGYQNFDSKKIIAGVHWSLLYEWGFYFSLPFIYILIQRKIPDYLILILCSIPVLYILSTTAKRIYIIFLLAYFSIIIKDKATDFIKKYNFFSNISVFILIFYILFFTEGYSFLQQFLLCIFFIFVSNGTSMWVLNNKGLKIIGDLSYSIYLIHGLVLYFLFTIFNIFDFNNSIYSFIAFFPLVFVFTITISIFTHRFIEKRFMHMRFSSKFNRKANTYV